MYILPWLFNVFCTAVFHANLMRVGEGKGIVADLVVSRTAGLTGEMMS